MTRQTGVFVVFLGHNGRALDLRPLAAVPPIPIAQCFCCCVLPFTCAFATVTGTGVTVATIPLHNGMDSHSVPRTQERASVTRASCIVPSVYGSAFSQACLAKI